MGASGAGALAGGLFVVPLTQQIRRTGLVVGGAVTGSFIGFFWHPVAALAAALLVVALVAVGDR